MCQRFLYMYNQKRTFSLIRQKTKNFPIDPHYKSRSLLLRHRHDVTKFGDFYNGGLWRNFSFFVGSNWNFVSYYIKNVDTQHESFSTKNQVIKILSPKSLWKTNRRTSRRTIPVELRFICDLGHCFKDLVSSAALRSENIGLY